MWDANEDALQKKWITVVNTIIQAGNVLYDIQPSFKKWSVNYLGSCVLSLYIPELDYKPISRTWRGV